MTLCVFVLIASEFMPVSLLTLIASDLHITEGLAGQGIAISGALAVITSLTISHIAGDLNRKHLLQGLTVLMAISGIVVALAPSYPVYMLGRALLGVVIGGFWSMSAATAIRLVPQHQVPRALAIFNGGNALATVVAAPLGSYLGTTVGWRGAFLCLVPLAIAAFIWQWVSLPSMENDKKQKSQRSMRHLFRITIVPAGLLACGFFFMGQFALFTYVRPFLETVTLRRPYWSLSDFARNRRGGFCRHTGRINIPEHKFLSDFNHDPPAYGSDCRGVTSGWTQHLGCCRIAAACGDY